MIWSIVAIVCRQVAATSAVYTTVLSISAPLLVIVILRMVGQARIPAHTMRVFPGLPKVARI